MQQLKAYQKFLQQLMNLEQQLIRAFEAQVELAPPPEFIEYYRSKLEHIDWANHSISQILSLWPDRGVIFSLAFLLKQRKGVIVLNGQNWLFIAHGSDEVRFTHLSPTLDVHLLEQLKQGKTRVLDGMRSWYGDDGEVEAKYLLVDRFDWVSAWSAYVFASSIDCPFRHLSESEHHALLETLVDKGVLVHWPNIGVRHGYFMFATANGEAEPAER